MTIVIDGRMTAERWTGIGLYGRQLIDQLQQLDRANQYIILLERSQYRRWRPAASNFRAVEANQKVYGLSEQLTLPFLLWRLRPDVVHFLHFNAPMLYRRRRVVTIHDLTLFDFPTARPGGLGRIRHAVKSIGMRLIF